jgi:hypothetical protein
MPSRPRELAVGTVLSREWHGKEVLVLAMCYCGDIQAGEKATQKLRAIGTPIADVVGEGLRLSLVGVVIGLVSALCYVALGVSGLLPTPFAEQFTVNALGASVSALIYSPIMGAFFAAAAAWYRRFLALSSPNRNRRPSQTPKQRPGDGRTRTGSSQKAPAKR